jgi:predicted RNA-binding protein associated with RNAse of E/G family
LDEDEFNFAEKKNWIDEKLAEKSRDILAQIIKMLENKSFLPKFIKEYGNKFKI